MEEYAIEPYMQDFQFIRTPVCFLNCGQDGWLHELFATSAKILKWFSIDPVWSIEDRLTELEYIEEIALFAANKALIREMNYTAEDGTTIQTHIDSTLTFIESHGPSLVDKETFVGALETATDPSVPSEMHIRCSFTTIVHRFKEIQEVLARADGNLDETFQISEESPFLHTEFITMKNYNSVVHVERKFYADENYIDQWNVRNEHLTTSFEVVDYDENDREFMANSTQKVNLVIENYKKKFNDEDYFTEDSIHDLFMRSAEYLSHLKEYINIEISDEDLELEKDILTTIDDLTFMMHSLPLKKLFDLYFEVGNHTGINCLKSIFRIVNDILIQVNNNSLRLKISKLRMVVLQIWNIFKIDWDSDTAALSCEVIAELAIPIKPRTRPDIVTEESFVEWKNKFESCKSKEAIIKKCPHDKCYICFQKFADILEDSSTSGDLAVFHKCWHLFCVKCIRETVREAPNE